VFAMPADCVFFIFGFVGVHLGSLWSCSHCSSMGAWSLALHSSMSVIGKGGWVGAVGDSDLAGQPHGPGYL
jgi:hypothetical protein